MTEIEIWKPIPDHAPYEASSFGRIRNGAIGNILSPVWRGPKRKQYLAVYIGGGRGACKKAVHRLVLMAFFGMPPDGCLGCHKDDNTENNRIDNLYWGTHKSNVADQIKSGNFYYAIGEGNGNTSHSDEVIKKIRSEYTGKRGEQSALARKYNMSISNIHLIVHDKTRRTA